VAGAGTADIGIIVWFLRWVPSPLGHAGESLDHELPQCPFWVNAMWNARCRLPAWLWPFTSSFGPIFSYNLWSHWRLPSRLVRVSGSPALCRASAGAALAGLLYGFSPS